MKYGWLAGFLVAACSASESPPDAQPHESEVVQGITTTGAVLMHHNDMARTGLNPNETVLTPTTVATNFGKQRELPTVGYVYAQPLFVPGVVIGGLVRDVVYVADEADYVYAFDAGSGALLWQTSVGTAANGSDLYGYDGTLLVDPVAGGTIGITSTPVIDPATNTLYVIAMDEPVHGSFEQLVVAIDLVTGAKTAQHAIAASSRGITFDPKRAHQRTGLLLWNGKIYAAWGGFNVDAIDDPGPRIWHGWVMSFTPTATSISLANAWVTTSTTDNVPCCGSNAIYGGGIWMGGAGLATDGTHLFVGVGEGKNDGATDWGESMVALDGNLNVTGHFTPGDATLDMNDEDMTGVMILPNTNVLGHATTLATADKRGDLYILDRSSLALVVSRTQAVGQDPAGGEKENFLGLPALYNGVLYYAGNKDRMKRFTIDASGLTLDLTHYGADHYGYMGSTPSISSNGTSDGVVWSIDRLTTDPYSYPYSGVLLAYDPATLATLYTSATEGDNPLATVQFTPPTVAGGRVFVAGEHVAEYGTLLSLSTSAVTVQRASGYAHATLTTSVRANATSYALSATLVPTGVTVTFTPATVAAGSASTIKISAGATAAYGTYPIIINATEVGHPTWVHSVYVNVTVIPPVNN